MSEPRPNANPDPGPTSPNPSVDTLDRFAERDRSRYVAMARARLSRLGIEETVLSAEGAVQEAWIRLCRRMNDGRTPPINPQDFDRIFTGLLLQAIVDTRREQDARKRSAPPRDHRDPALLELVDRQAVPPEDHVAAEDHVQWLLSLLGGGRAEAPLRQVLTLRLEGRSNREIAAQLGLKDVKSVERKVQKIRSILGPFLGPHE